MILDLILYLAVAGGLYALWVKYYRGARHPDTFLRNKIVFISGCDTGFGERTSLALYKKGFRVFSGCLTDKGMENLTTSASHFSAGGSITPIKCDITKEEDVVHAHKIVAAACAEAGTGVWAIINNAGVGTGGPVEWSSLATYQRVMDVNFFGHVRVTKAFLPLIRKGQGRVINVTSMAGCVALPHMSAYAATKHAFEAFNNSLRGEMHYFGIYVVCIAPMFMKTPIVDDLANKLGHMWTELTPELQKEFDPKYNELLGKMQEGFVQSAESPQIVVDALVDSVSLLHPLPKYTLGSTARKYELMSTLLPSIILDFISTPNIRALKTELRR